MTLMNSFIDNVNITVSSTNLDINITSEFSHAPGCTCESHPYN